MTRIPVRIEADSKAESKSGWYEDVLDFHKALNVPAPSTPAIPSVDRVKLRLSLIEEEHHELVSAACDYDLPKIADSLADLIYVCIGMAIEYGIDLRPVWDAVQESNMLKKDGAVRIDGKRLKPEWWKHPDIREILKKQGWEETFTE